LLSLALRVSFPDSLSGLAGNDGSSKQESGSSPKTVLKRSSDFLVVFALLLLAMFARPYLLELSWWHFLVVALTPGGILGLASLLSLYLDRCRMFFISLVLAASYVMRTGMLVSSSDLSVDSAYGLVGVLLPLNLILLAIIREKGTFTLWGSTKFLLVFGQIALLVFVMKTQPEGVADVLSRAFDNSGVFDWTRVPLPALFALSFALVFFTSLLIQEPSVHNTVLLGVVLAVASALHFAGAAAWASFYSAAGLMILYALIRDFNPWGQTDPLTGLPTRRALRAHLAKLGGPYALALVELDQLRKLNHTHGRDRGDEALRHVAARLQILDEAPQIYWFDGGKFALVFADEDEAAAAAILDRVRGRIAEHGFTLRQRERRRLNAETLGKPRVVRKLELTVSIGLTESDSMNPNPRAVIEAAVKALYRAMRTGGNRTCTTYTAPGCTETDSHATATRLDRVDAQLRRFMEQGPAVE
jgi:diguanylate cyclase (GGDEF)-like protein